VTPCISFAKKKSQPALGAEHRKKMYLQLAKRSIAISVQPNDLVQKIPRPCSNPELGGRDLYIVNN
jgi:hypothetical protein